MSTNDNIEKAPALNTNTSEIETNWWHWVIGAALVLLLTLLSPRGKSPEFAYLELGSISSHNIIAPFDFEILKSPGELNKERKDASGNVLPVLTVIDTIKEVYSRELVNFTGASQEILRSFPPSIFETTAEKQRSLSSEDSILLGQGGEKLFNRFGFRLADDTWKFLIQLYDLEREGKKGEYNRFFERFIDEILLYVYNHGVIDVPKDQLIHPSGTVMIQHGGEEEPVELNRLLTTTQALERISSLLSSWLNDKDFPTDAMSAGYEILQPFLSHNIIYNEKETENRRNAAIAKVPLAKGFVKKDELIIGANIKVIQDHIDKLNSLAIKRAELGMEQGGFRALMPVIGHFMLALLIVLLYGLFIMLRRQNIWRQWKLILLIALVIGFGHLFQALVPVKHDLSRFIFPAAVSVMLLAILVDEGVALAGIVTIGLIAGLIQGNDFPVALSSVAVGGAALYAVRKVQTRVDVMRAIFYLLGIYIPVVTAFHFLRSETGIPLLNDLALASANAVLSPMLVLGLVIICESVFNITTGLTLLELVDLNRPLLRELAIKSPGTYHHSIIVGNLAEVAAREIGANGLLTRAGAYYHDIGKMEHKEYFIENQEVGSFNIHDRLAPDKSAAMVINHVKLGLELAEKYRLPEQIKAFIIEHHGRTRLAFFYDKAIKEKGDDVDDRVFRYPGPGPQTKETGIAMLADAVEAATRSMDKHSTHDLEETVDALIRARLWDGDLDQCPLTLKEIGKIKYSFTKVLSGIYHQRIQYPGQKTAEDATGKGEASQTPEAEGDAVEKE